MSCLNIVLNRDNPMSKNSCYWPELICFSTDLFDTQKTIISNQSESCDWFTQHAKLEDDKKSVNRYSSYSPLTIWY